MLDAHPVGHLARVFRAERELASALVALDAEMPDGVVSVARVRHAGGRRHS